MFWLISKNGIAVNVERTDRISIKQSDDKNYKIVAYQGNIRIILKDGFQDHQAAEIYLQKSIMGIE